MQIDSSETLIGWKSEKPLLFLYWNEWRERALQITLELCIPEKELAKARSQISFIYFQSHS
jgi:hypothetical protein